MTAPSKLITLPGLLTPSAAYKPFRYPWAFDMWKKQQQVHWMPEEVPLGEDMKDWAVNLSDSERNLLTQIFRFFTQADIEVQDNYMEKYGRVFKPTEVKMMLASFANMETIHIAAYALLLETIGMPESEFAAFLEYEAMRDKHDFMQKFGVETNADIARRIGYPLWIVAPNRLGVVHQILATVSVAIGHGLVVEEVVLNDVLPTSNDRAAQNNERLLMPFLKRLTPETTFLRNPFQG